MRFSPLHHIPLALTALRAVLGPVVAILAFWRPDLYAFAVCLILAFLSDYFDGVIARHLGVSTPNLRRLDSLADSVFYISALLAAWHLHADLLRQYATPMAVLLALELLRYAFDYWKFGREASYHMWSSKFWGLTLFGGFYALLVHGNGEWPVALAIYVGIAADLEGLAISLVLGEWKTDVPTLFHAFKLRKAQSRRSAQVLP